MKPIWEEGGCDSDAYTTKNIRTQVSYGDTDRKMKNRNKNTIREVRGPFGDRFARILQGRIPYSELAVIRPQWVEWARMCRTRDYLFQTEIVKA